MKNQFIDSNQLGNAWPEHEPSEYPKPENPSTEDTEIDPIPGENKVFQNFEVVG